MVDATAKLNLGAKYEKTSWITFRMFCCNKILPWIAHCMYQIWKKTFCLSVLKDKHYFWLDNLKFCLFMKFVGVKKTEKIIKYKHSFWTLLSLFSRIMKNMNGISWYVWKLPEKIKFTSFFDVQNKKMLYSLSCFVATKMLWAK